MLLALWSGFWDWAGGSEPVDTHDGGYYLNAVEYRKHLENIVKITDERMFKKNIKKVVKKLNKAPLAIQEIIQPKIEVIEAQPDFRFVDSMAQELLAAIAELNLYIQKIERKRQEEEEFLFILQCAL